LYVVCQVCCPIFFMRMKITLRGEVLLGVK
jgi:hypothetical protein